MVRLRAYYDQISFLIQIMIELPYFVSRVNMYIYFQIALYKTVRIENKKEKYSQLSTQR